MITVKVRNKPNNTAWADFALLRDKKTGDYLFTLPLAFQVFFTYFCFFAFNWLKTRVAASITRLMISVTMIAGY